MRCLRFFLLGGPVAAFLAIFAACATFPPPKEAIESRRSFENRYDDVWEAALAVFSDRNIPVKSSNRESGKIVAEDNTVELRQYEPGRYDSLNCFCGSPELYHRFGGIFGTYTVEIASAGEHRSSLTIEASYRASAFSGEKFTGWHSCPSKGSFEPSFLGQVESRLNTRKSQAPAASSPRRNLDWWKPRRGY